MQSQDDSNLKIEAGKVLIIGNESLADFACDNDGCSASTSKWDATR
jgi:hypothetical protein